MTSAGVIDYVIDINPHKQGRYVPGTGQKVISPRELAAIRPQIVIAMNPLYTVEIERMIGDTLPKQKDSISVLSVDRIDDENDLLSL